MSISFREAASYPAGVHSPTLHRKPALYNFLAAHPLFAAILLATAVQLFDAAFGVTPILSGGLADADCYSRLARVLQLHQSGAWWDHLDHWINAPYGETLQWTRPLDLLIELWAEPLGLLIPYKTGLFIVGALISPLLLVGTLAVLWWWGKDRLGPRGFLLAAALLQVSPSLIGTYLPGRPDHHSLLAFLFLAQILLVLRVVGGAGPRWSVVNGFVGGLALWVSLESAVPQAYFGLALVLLWATGRLALVHVTAYSAALFLSVSLAIAVEFPPALWLAPAYDRISIVQAGLLGLTAGLWLGIGLLRPSRPAGRWMAALLSGALLAAAVLVFTPKLLAGPFVDHGVLGREWLANVAEWQPLWPSDRGRAAEMFNELGPTLVVIPWLVCRRQTAASLLLLGGILLFDGMSLQAVRWASYAQAVLLLPWAELVLHLWTRHQLPLRRPLAAAATAVGLFLGLCCGPKPADDSGEAACPVPSLAVYLDAALRPAGEGRPVLLTYLFVGPELEWRTHFNVVGIPSANEVTISDTQAILGSTDDVGAMAALQRRGIDYILLCPSSKMARGYRNATGDTLHQRLEGGITPSWLHPETLPSDLGGFRLYRVNRPS